MVNYNGFIYCSYSLAFSVPHILHDGISSVSVANNAAYKIISNRFTGGIERDKSNSFVSNTNNILRKQNEENGKNALLCHGAMYRCVCICECVSVSVCVQAM